MTFNDFFRAFLSTLNTRHYSGTIKSTSWFFLLSFVEFSFPILLALNRIESGLIVSFVFWHDGRLFTRAGIFVASFAAVQSICAYRHIASNRDSHFNQGWNRRPNAVATDKSINTRSIARSGARRQQKCSPPPMVLRRSFVLSAHMFMHSANMDISSAERTCKRKNKHGARCTQWH